MKARQNLTSFISFAAYLRYQASSPSEPPSVVGHQERQFAGGDDRKAAGLIAGIDVSEVGDAVARHVVMVEGLAELLRRVNLVMQRAAGRLLDRGAPFLQRLLQRMRGGTQCESLSSKVFSWASAGLAPIRLASAVRQGTRRSETSWKSSLGYVLVSHQFFYYSAVCRKRCKVYSLISNYVSACRKLGD